MDNYFITSVGKLRLRWGEAFPDGVAVAGVTAIPVTLTPGSAIVWLDLSSIEPDGQAQALLDSVATGCAVVALSSHPYEAEGIRALNAGALGYCHAYAPPRQLREIAQVVQHGGVWMIPELMQRFLALSLRVVKAETQFNCDLGELTARELAVAGELAQGLSNREIAEALDITERTVKAHISSTLAKLGLRDRVQLALAVSGALSGSSVN